MKPACPFDAAPLEYILPDKLPTALGLQNAGIAASLASCRFLRAAVSRRVLSALPALPEELPQARVLLFAELTVKSPEELSELCRVMTIMMNHKSILATTSGVVLREIASWCGDQALLLSLDKTRFPIFASLQVLDTASCELLALYEQKVRGLLFGVLPHAHRQRLELRLRQSDLCEPVAFAPDDPDEAFFLRYLTLALEYCDAKA